MIKEEGKGRRTRDSKNLDGADVNSKQFGAKLKVDAAHSNAH